MQITNDQLKRIIKEELENVLYEKCQKGYKTHPTRKTKKMFGRTYRNCVKAEESLREEFIPGGESSKYGQMELDEMIGAIAEEHGVSEDQIRSEFEMGVEEEMEHADEELIAQEIALDHLVEDPKYYTKLERANLEEAKKKRKNLKRENQRRSPKVKRKRLDLNLPKSLL